jgi:CRISPR-associated protein Cas1
LNASDVINALLNYGYAILESPVRKYINAVGLGPSVGFLHELAPSKQPLVYDLQELYRWIVDLSIIQLLEDKKLKKSDFIVTENYHIRLREDTAKMLIDQIKANFNARSLYKNKNAAYERLKSFDLNYYAYRISCCFIINYLYKGVEVLFQCKL